MQTLTLKKLRVTTLTRDKVDFRTSKIITDRDITSEKKVNPLRRHSNPKVYRLKNRNAKYEKQKLVKLKEEIDKSKNTISSSVFLFGRTRKKLSKDIEKVKDTIN